MGVIKYIARQIKFYDEAKLSNVTTPILCLSGETDKLTLPEHAKKLASKVNGKFEIFPGTSHNLMLEKPKEVSKRIIDFLFNE